MKPWAIPAYLWVAAVGVALGAIDIEVHRLPDVLTLPSYGAVAALLLIPTVVYDEWSSYVRAALAALVLFGFYFLLAFIKPGAMGFGAPLTE